MKICTPLAGFLSCTIVGTLIPNISARHYRAVKSGGGGGGRGHGSGIIIWEAKDRDTYNPMLEKTGSSVFTLRVGGEDDARGGGGGAGAAGGDTASVVAGAAGAAGVAGAGREILIHQGGSELGTVVWRGAVLLCERQGRNTPPLLTST